MTFHFRGDDIERINVSANLEGNYYDAELIPTPFALDGPPYQPERRPTVSALLAGRPPLTDPFTLPPRPEIDDAPEPLEIDEAIDDLDADPEDEPLLPEDRFRELPLPEPPPPETNARDDAGDERS